MHADYDQRLDPPEDRIIRTSCALELLPVAEKRGFQNTPIGLYIEAER